MNVNNFISIIENLLSYFFTNIFQTNYAIHVKATLDLDDIIANSTELDTHKSQHHFKFTYELYMNILRIIQHNDLSVKRIMPEVLKLLNPQVKLPSPICNLTNKVKRFKGDSKMAIESILPQRYIGPYCKRENLKTSYLQGNKQHLLITTDYVTNGLIYELEQYRWKEKLSIDSALEWIECFFPMTTHQSTSAQAHNHAWKTVYDRVTSLKHSVKKDKSTINIQQEHLEGFLLLQYIPPSAQLSNKEQLVDAL